jgi:hypothetical protein
MAQAGARGAAESARLVFETVTGLTQAGASSQGRQGLQLSRAPNSRHCCIRHWSACLCRLSRPKLRWCGAGAGGAASAAAVGMAHAASGAADTLAEGASAAYRQVSAAGAAACRSCWRRH